MTYNVRGRRPKRAPFRGSRRRSGGKSAHIDVSKFINKPTKVEETEVFEPKHTFRDFALEPLLVTNIEKKGYETPTPIQDESIKPILEGRDILGIANTGTGKTAAFLIPLINKIVKDPKERVLVIVPTRELAGQIEEELRDFAKDSGLYSAICIGGASIGAQIRELRGKPHFVVGTPGRLKDLLESGHIHLSSFSTVVLDEADRMLDMGFIRDIRFMLSKMPKDRHTLFFSATLSKEIEGLVNEFLNDPIRVSVKTRDTSKNVHQDIVRIPRGEAKLNVLHNLLTQDEFSKVLVFGRTKHGVEKLSKALQQRGIKSESIHGNKRQRERQRALDKFKADGAQVLIATDVAARGLDISDVSHVINFDVPATFDDYVHRIGRTGRGGAQGKALTFVE